ncbi:site-specific integrase [Mycobacterium kansasii]|uniref:site-specific integrase n=1 Tax=Mycobacterium avium complex (MAC) TaxID=120793 RepID=UPI0003D236AF|nr:MULTISPECIES: site-specific integrase [Mycobacterium avium complex (MAC)]ETA95444.1 integrase [Mycobacterium avium 10-5581]ETB27168.1 integrase [Mycobacterium avium subsp. hominissuis 10-4249]ATO61452.2 site-specific integrase [Mycobacterium avium subsp. hominissuis]ATO66007.1 site-specific integrase [Mycobacterium avium subsp. hominissuis]ATO70586.1 site-specific integrase [Mycobacterium avium subsp. hominissuis]
MAGSVPRGIRKRTNSAGQARYQVRYLVRDPNSPSGWVETSSTFATMREARAFKADRDGEAAIGARRFDPRLGRASLSAIWTQYSASKQPAVSPKTWSGYAQHWELRISPRFGHVPVDEISRKDVQQFIGGLTVGPWAKLATLRLLRSILDMAREDGRIHINPAQAVSSGRIPARERHRYLSATEVAALANACGDQGDIVTILAFTGLRWSELVGLRVGDIDLKARRLYVRQAAPEVEGRIIVGPPKTRAAVRTVPLPRIVIDALKPRIENRSTKEQAITSPNGGFLRSNNWRRHTHWNKALKKTGLAPLTIHDLRHTYASLARKSGADLRYVQKTMGHSTPTVTANIYSDLYSDELDHVATNLDRLNDVAKDQANGQEPDTPKHP